MNIFAQNDYRAILRQAIEERKQLDPSINFQEMAAFIRVPKSYLSRVVNGKANLSSDQLFQICEYLNFNKTERNFLQLLLEHARTGLKTRKKLLTEEINLMQSQYLDTKEYLRSAAIVQAGDEITEYYLDPLIQIIHICLSIHRYRKDLALLARDLNIASNKLLKVINKLEQWNLIERGPKGIKLVVQNMHLPKTAPVYKSWRNQLKLLAINKIDSIEDDDGYSFAVIFSATEEVKKLIQRRFLEYLNEVEALVGASPQEDTYQMSFELFPWTKGALLK